MRKRFIFPSLIVLLALLFGYELYTSNKGRELLTAAHIVSGLALATPVKIQVAEFYNVRGELPSSNAELNLPEPGLLSGRSVKSIEVSSGGRITITYKNAIKKDSSIILLPSLTAAYPVYGIKWKCVTEGIDQSFFENISMPCTYVPPGNLSRLMKSIASANEVETRAAILAGANVNGALYGETPLFSAISRNQYSISQQLISVGVDINQVSSTGRKITPLIHSVILGKEKIVELLLDNNANIDATDGVGKTALMYGIEKGRKNIVETLLSHGANPLLKDARGKDAMRYAKRYGRRSAISDLLESAALAYAAKLARGGAVGGVTPLMRATRKGNTQKVKTLIAGGSVVGAVDNFDATALHYALDAQQFVIAKMLITADITVNSVDRDGFTPLMLAVKAGSPELVSALLQAGAEVKVENKYRRSPFLMAVRYGNKNIVSLLLNAGVAESVNQALYESFVSPAQKADSVSVQSLILAAGLAFDRSEKNGELLLIKAVQKNRLSVARFLLKQGVNVETDIEGLPLHVAAKSGAMELPRLLVDSGADVNALTAQGQTALMFAVKARNIHLVKYLLDAGARVDVTDVNGVSALRMAKANFSEDIVALLRHYKK